MVDWLGRGGIAHTTEAWVIELCRRGFGVEVVTRGARELVGPHVLVPPKGRAGRFGAHVAVAELACRAISESRPDSVVVQNFVLPPLEAAVHRAARRSGARLVFVVHDHRLHSAAAGTSVGLRRLICQADVVVAHSAFVAERVAKGARRNDVVVVPHPIPLGLLASQRPPRPFMLEGPEPLAVHFGILKRGYKGTGLVLSLARQTPSWRFAVMGVGAPQGVPGVTSVARYVEKGELCGAVEQSAVTLLPYRIASQSGAVVLAQALGSVPIASAVGGIPEQIDEGSNGRLLPLNSGVVAWRNVLEELTDPDVRGRMRGVARAHVQARHEEFVSMAGRLLG